MKKVHNVSGTEPDGHEIVSVQVNGHEIVFAQGENFETIVWKPKNKCGRTTTGEVREYFDGLGFCGQNFAFEEWHLDYSGMCKALSTFDYYAGDKYFVGGKRYFATIPKYDEECPFDPRDRTYFACAFIYDGSTGKMKRTFHDIDEPWGSEWTFVAFRKLSRG